MRLELTRKTELAARALRALAPADLTKGSTLSRELGTTPYYLPQVMQPLVAQGWVRSVPGPSGGYGLDPSAQGVTLRQLIEAVEGSIVDGRCVLRDAPCPVPEPCGLHHPWSRARDAMLAELSATPVITRTTTNRKERS